MTSSRLRGRIRTASGAAASAASSSAASNKLSGCTPRQYPLAAGWRGDVDARLLALLRGDRRGRAGERVVAGGGLGEGDDVADAVAAGQQHEQAVPAERDAAVRGRPEAQGLEQEAELRGGLLAGQAD